MEVISLCPLPVASLLWQPRPGAWMFTFACKATYELRPGESPLAPDQEPINESDRHWSNDPAWSVYAPRDIVPIRPRADVVLVGHAFAPDGNPVRSLVARLLAADVDKSIEVFCDRSFTQDGALHDGPRFTKMPLLYERAGGGPETSNPVGMRPDARDTYGKRELPNMQQPGILVASASDAVEPIGFGPIAPAWPSRRNKLGRHAASWSDDAFHLQPLPQDIDASYFNAAPRDQQTATLRDNERIVLDNLHADVPHLVTNLCGHHPQAFVERHGKPPQSVSMRPDLLWIHTDRGICTLTWRGQIPLEHAREAGLVRVALEGPGQVLTWEDVERLARQGSKRPEGAHVVDIGETGETLVPVTRPMPEPGEEEDPLVGTMAAPFELSQPAAVLPFAATAGGAAPAPRPNDAAQRLAGTPFAGAGAQLPFQPPAPPPPAIVPPAPIIAPAPGVVPMPAPVVAPVVAPPPLVLPTPLAAPASADSPWSSGAARSPGAPGLTVGAAAAQAAGSLQPQESPGARGGVVGASNAAAAAGAPFVVPRSEATPAPAQPQPTGFAVRPAARPEAQEVLQLIWFDPDSVPRIRRQPSWRKIIEDLAKKPIDKDLDDPALSKEPEEVEDRREIFEILAQASATDAEGIQEALTEGVRDGGKYLAPLKLVTGDLIFPFDELETLKATVTTVTPLIGNDEHLRATVLAAQDFLKLPDLRSAPAVAEGLTTRIRDAFAQGKRVVPQGYLDAQTERVLLEQRHYQRRAVFGKPHLRALMQPLGSSHQIPAYLPDALAKELPMYQRFRARLITEVHMQLDQYETHPAALRVAALVRAVPPTPPAQRR